MYEHSNWIRQLQLFSLVFSSLRFREILDAYVNFDQETYHFFQIEDAQFFFISWILIFCNWLSNFVSLFLHKIDSVMLVASSNGFLAYFNRIKGFFVWWIFKCVANWFWKILIESQKRIRFYKCFQLKSGFWSFNGIQLNVWFYD